jgi:hypothetical protein
MIAAINAFSGNFEVVPQAVPTAAAIVTGISAHLKNVTVSNPTAGALTFTLTDQQAAPIAAIPAVSIPANDTVIFSWPFEYLCPGGFTVLASGAGLTFHATWR